MFHFYYYTIGFHKIVADNPTYLKGHGPGGSLKDKIVVGVGAVCFAFSIGASIRGFYSMANGINKLN